MYSEDSGDYLRQGSEDEAEEVEEVEMFDEGGGLVEGSEEEGAREETRKEETVEF